MGLIAAGVMIDPSFATMSPFFNVTVLPFLSVTVPPKQTLQPFASVTSLVMGVTFIILPFSMMYIGSGPAMTEAPRQSMAVRASATRASFEVLVIIYSGFSFWF
ncbi:MAG: hypothetical protein WDN28_02940 [Chthoniobacter sp.]